MRNRAYNDSISDLPIESSCSSPRQLAYIELPAEDPKANVATITIKAKKASASGGLDWNETLFDVDVNETDY